MNHRLVISSHNQQNRCLYIRQRLSSEIGPATSRNNSSHPVGKSGGGDQRRGSSGARSKQTDLRKVIGLPSKPFEHARRSTGKQVNVKAQMPGLQIDLFLGGRQ